MEWCLQDEKNQLGSFIMVTPTLRALSEISGNPFPVFFSTPKISQLFQKCPFIRILDNKPTSPPLFVAKRAHNRKNKESNYCCFFRQYAQSRGYDKPMPLPYVDECHSDFDPGDKKHIAVFQGCLSNHLIDKKCIESSVMSYVLKRLNKKDIIPVILGSERDKKFWREIDLKNSVDLTGKESLIECVGTLSKCDAFISNDTGLYHVAGALGLRGLVMWYKTPFHDNKAPCKRISHKICSNRKKHYKVFSRVIDNFLEEI